MFISDTLTMVTPTPPPMPTQSSHFDLSNQISRLSFDQHDEEEHSFTVHPTQDDTFGTNETTTHVTLETASTIDDDRNDLRAKITELEAENIHLKECLRTSEEIIDTQLQVSETERGAETSPFGPRTTTFLLNRGLQPETNSIFWELLAASPDQQQWRSLLADLFQMTQEDLEDLLVALYYDFALIRLKKASAPLGGARALSNINKS